MTVETFFANFGHLADAPNGMQKLRELILQLAVQGKLVPQDPNGEPASIALEQFIAEKAAMAKQKKSPKSKAIQTLSKDGKYCQVPINWEWVRLGQVVEVLDSLRKPVTKHNRKPGPYPYYGASGIVDYVSDYLFDEPLVLVGEDGAKWGCGDNTAFTISGKTWVNNHAHVLRPFRSVLDAQYLVYALIGSDLKPYITGITVPKLNQAKLVSIEVPLPPLKEQKRIVIKVDQLMALCDELEARQKKQQQGRVRLNNAALDALLTAREPIEFADHWQRISTNFDLLYDHPETIAKLRTAILQLAVQGKLVPQDPNDEPASVLLGRIKAEKERLVKEGEIRKTKPLSQVSETEVSFCLPNGWGVERFGNLTNIVGGVTKGRKLAGRKTAFFPYLRVANVQRWFVDIDVMKEIEIPIEELEKYKLKTGDLLITEGGDWDKVGRTAVWEGQIDNCLHQNHVFRARLFVGDLNRDWLVLAINSPVGREYFANSSKQTTNLASINMTQLKHFPMPVPSAEEQKRIVAKVDQLMALCDVLEAKLNQAQQHSEKLMEATVRQLLVA